MSSDLIRDRAGGTPPFVKPFLHALNRLQERETLRPTQLTDRAHQLLRERFGPSEGEEGATPGAAAFAHGATGLLGDHTHYFDGFALLCSLPHGTAVALRAASGPSRVTFDGGETWTFGAEAGADSAQESVWTRLVGDLLRTLAPEGGVDAAVVSTVHASCVDGYLSALGMATARALQELFSLDIAAAALQRLVREQITQSADWPFSIAYPITADVGRPGVYTLVDTGTKEQLPLEAPSHDALGWGLVDVGGGGLRSAAFYQGRKRRVDEALTLLQEGGFPQLSSLRELEHRDLQRALDVLPRRYRPLVRHLVTENRRVQRLVAAVRRRDWQMFGALLLMSHASVRSDWRASTDAVDFVVEQVEAMSIEGLYGACVTGRGGCVLVLGQPFSMPRGLDRIKAAFEAQFGRAPDAMLL